MSIQTFLHFLHYKHKKLQKKVSTTKNFQVIKQNTVLNTKKKHDAD